MTGKAAKASLGMEATTVNGLVSTYCKGPGDYWFQGTHWVGRVLYKGAAVGQYWKFVDCPADVWKELQKEIKYKMIQVPLTWEKIVDRYSGL